MIDKCHCIQIWSGWVIWDETTYELRNKKFLKKIRKAFQEEEKEEGNEGNNRFDEMMETARRGFFFFRLESEERCDEVDYVCQ